MIPKLRFQEFRGNYSHSTFKDYVVINQGLQIAISDRLNSPIDGAYFYITNEFLRSNSLKSYWVNNPPKSSICSFEDILMTRTGNTGIVVTDVQGVFHNNFFKIKYPNDLFNKVWLVEYLRRDAIQKQILRYAGTSTIPDLNHKDFYRLPLLHPSIEEQTKIANLQSILNSKINLLTKKKEALETYKKGLMQKIFSQELRFKRKDGTDYPEWEYVQLGEIGAFSTSSVDKKTIPNEPIVHLINYVDVYHHRDINNNTVSKMMTVSAKPTQLRSSDLKKGDILFTPSSETPDDIGHSVVIEEDIINGVYSYHLMRFRPRIEIDIPYSHFFCNHENVLKQIIRFATGSTRFTVSVGNFEKVVVPLPSIQEQKRIAAILKSVEGLIEELEKQFNSTLLLKKGLLQQMFV